MNKGILLVVSGPAGSGKSTVDSMLVSTGDFVYSVSATTRAARPGEVDGVNYHFITREEFEKKLENDEFLEHTEYCGNFYGTLKKEAIAVLESGKNLILEIEVEGAKNVKRIYPDAVLVMLLPPSFEIQEERLRGRATEQENKILERLEKTKKELDDIDVYDYIVYNHNGGADAAMSDVLSVVRAEKLARRRNPDAKDKYFEQTII